MDLLKAQETETKILKRGKFPCKGNVRKENHEVNKSIEAKKGKVQMRKDNEGMKNLKRGEIRRKL